MERVMADYPGAPPKQQQDIPGHTGPMSPKPDHGEHSYRGSGKLAGKRQAPCQNPKQR